MAKYKIANSRRLSMLNGIVNFFGVWGYLFCALQWLWAMMLYSNVIYRLTFFLGCGNESTKTPVKIASGPDLLTVVFMVTVTTIMIGMAIYAIIKMPSVVVNTGKKFVHKTAEAATPMVIKAQHKKDTKKFHIKITSRLILAVKTIMIAIPIIMVIPYQFFEKQDINLQIALVVGFSLMYLSATSFLLQYSLARLFRLKTQELW